MTVYEDVATGTWTAPADGTVQATLYGGGSGGQVAASGFIAGRGGGAGCRSITNSISVTKDEVLTVVKAASVAADTNGNFSSVTRQAGTILCKAVGGIRGGAGGVTVVTGCVGDSITVGGAGVASPDDEVGGRGGHAPGQVNGGAAATAGTAPGGGGGGNNSGSTVAGGGAAGRVDLTFTPAPTVQTILSGVASELLTGVE